MDRLRERWELAIAVRLGFCPLDRVVVFLFPSHS